MLGKKILSDVSKTEVWEIMERNVGIGDDKIKLSSDRQMVLMDEMFFAALQHKKKISLTDWSKKTLFVDFFLARFFSVEQTRIEWIT